MAVFVRFICRAFCRRYGRGKKSHLQVALVMLVGRVGLVILPYTDNLGVFTNMGFCPIMEMVAHLKEFMCGRAALAPRILYWD